MLPDILLGPKSRKEWRYRIRASRLVYSDFRSICCIGRDFSGGAISDFDCGDRDG